MAHFLTLALSFPSIVFTVLLGVAFVYWLFVIVGAARINLLGDADVDTDADIDHDVDASHDVDHDADADHDADHDAEHPGGATSGILAALMLRKAPATIVLSSIIVFAWGLSVIGAWAADFLPVGALVAKIAVLLAAPVLALFPTSVVVRPLGKLFTMPEAAANEQLVGKVCTIRTGTVTDRFGEATLDDGGAGVVVRVRVDAGEKLERGQQALIVGYDEDKEEFTVAPVDDMLRETKR